MAGIHGEVWLYRCGLTLFGAIDTVWRKRIVVFGLCDAAKWGQYRRVVSMPPSGANTCGTPVWARGRGRLGTEGCRRAHPNQPATAPKYGHLLPTCRPRATMAT